MNYSSAYSAKTKNGRMQIRILPFMKADQTYKPGSVFDNDLSWPQVASRLQPRFRKHDGPPYRFLLVLLRIGFTGPHSLLHAGELLPRRSTLTWEDPGGIFLLHFPEGYPCRPLAVILPLWSSDFPQTRPFGTAPAAA